ENVAVEYSRRTYVVGHGIISARAHALGADNTAPEIESGENQSARGRPDADPGAEGLSQEARDDLLECAGDVAARRRIIGRQDGNGRAGRKPRLMETRVGRARQVGAPSRWGGRSR